jgi:NADPH2:quinone reductase
MQGVFSPSSLDQEHERVFSMVEAILQNIAAGVLRVVIDRIFPLSEAAEAHRYVLGRNPFGRVLLQPEGRCQFYFSHLTG